MSVVYSVSDKPVPSFHITLQWFSAPGGTHRKLDRVLVVKRTLPGDVFQFGITVILPVTLVFMS